MRIIRPLTALLAEALRDADVPLLVLADAALPEDGAREASRVRRQDERAHVGAL